jgi:hypothetical protein
LLALGIAAAAAPAARAGTDMMELHGFVEPCTVAFVQDMYNECEACPVSPHDPGHCSAEMGRRGFKKNCRTRGDLTGWEEVWCHARSGLAETTPQPSRVPMLVGGAVLLGALVVTGGLWSRRRRARAKSSP